MKKLYKKISVVLLTLIMIISPVILTGCLSTDNISSSSGSNSSSSGGSNSGGDDFDTADYFDGFKVAFDNSQVNQDSFINSLYDAVYELSKSILIDLYSQYGQIVPSNGVTNQDETYYAGGTTPFMSKNDTIEDLETHAIYTYTADPKFSHENAIYEDSPIDETHYNKWNWTYEDNLSSNYQLSFISFVFNTHNIEKLSLAIIMIMDGKTVWNTSSTDYSNYLTITNNFALMTSADIESQIKQYASNTSHTGLYDEEQKELKEFILNVIIGKDLIELDSTRFVATTTTDQSGVGNYSTTDSNWGFYGDEMYFTFDILNDSNAEQNTEIVFYGNYVLTNKFADPSYPVATNLYQDLNENGDYDLAYEDRPNTSYIAFYRLSYFKNYVSTVQWVLNKYFPINYDNLGIGDTIFPLVPAGYYRDYSVADLQLVGDTYFPMSTGAQNYKNIVLMPNQALKLQDMICAVESSENFNLTVYVKYHTLSGWATWTSNGTETDAYKVSTYSVTKGKYNLLDSNANDFDIDFETILKTSKINGVVKNNCIINAFSNNTESFGASSVLSLTNTGSSHFKPVLNTTNGIQNVDYVDNSSEYVEVMFEANPSVLYKLNILFLYFDNV